MRWQNGDEAGRDRHHGDRELERAFAPDPVAEMAEQHPAEWARQVANSKNRECVEKSREPVFGWEELRTNRRRQEAENGEVVPFKHVANRARDD